MHPYNRLPSSGHSTPSPPQSPLRSPRLRHSRSKGGRFTQAQQPGRTFPQRLAWLILSVLLRRQGIFLFAPLIYISSMLLYMGTVSHDVVPVIKHRPAAGSVYRSPQLFAKLRSDMDADNSSTDAVRLCFQFRLVDWFLDVGLICFCIVANWLINWNRTWVSCFLVAFLLYKLSSIGGFLWIP